MRVAQSNASCDTRGTTKRWLTVALSLLASLVALAIFPSPCHGLSLLCGAAYVANEPEFLEGSIKAAAVAGSAASGFVLTFGVGRRFLTNPETTSAGPSAKE